MKQGWFNKRQWKSFSAGIDVSVLPMKSILEYRPWIQRMERMNLTISHMLKPVIVAAHGVAAANGAGLVAAADLAIVAQGTRIGATAINVGLFCMGPAVPISRSLGKNLPLNCFLPATFLTQKGLRRLALLIRLYLRKILWMRQ